MYRLITKDTYEGFMFNKASLKLGLDQAVLHPMTKSLSASASGDKLRKSDIEGLLKNGIHHMRTFTHIHTRIDTCRHDVLDIVHIFSLSPLPCLHLNCDGFRRLSFS